MRRVSISLLLLAAAPLFGQLPSNTLNIAATRSIVLQPDQVVFGLTVSTPVTVILFEVVDGLSGLGITSANLSGVDNSNATTLQWNFTLAVPLSNLAATINSLANFQQTSPRRSLLALTFSVNGTQVSQKLQQSQSCSNSDLISDATTQAQKLAAAAGMTLGPIVKLFNTPQLEIPAFFGLAEIGSFASLLNVVPNIYSPPLTCSLNVQFQLLH
jgi:hypothetical protein